MSHNLPSKWAVARLLGIVLATLLVGCQNNRGGVIPAPQGFGPSPYYTPPTAGAEYRPGSTAPGSAAVSLAPPTTAGASTMPAASNTSSASANTYNVATRTAADSEPIRILEPASRGPATEVVARGMPLNDGMQARPLNASLPLPASVSSNPFSGLRGTADARAGTQGFSGQEGQWRSRSSYEATERR